jgi:tungstate transport system permease protein
LGFILLAVVLALNALIALVTRWRGAHAEGVVLAGAAA